MPAQLTLPPVSTMKGTKLCWSAYLALLVAAYSSAATPGVVSAPHVYLDVSPPLVRRPLRILHPWLDRRLDLGESPQLPAQRVPHVVVAVHDPPPPAPAEQAVQRLLGE